MIAAASAADTVAGLLLLIAVLSVACLVMALFAWLEERRGEPTDFDVPLGRRRLGIDDREEPRP